MKKIIFPLFTIIALFVIPGCSEKFNIAASYKDITVVYGYLEMQDTAHYIRIQKAFLSQDKSALVMAQTADSSFYANLSVKIKRFRVTDIVHAHDTIVLTRVNLDQEGYPKEQGSFFTSPNYAYKFKQALDPDYIYRLVITNLTTGKVDSAESPVINDGDFSKYRVDPLDQIPVSTLDFHSTVGNRYFDLTGTLIPPVNYSFHGDANPIVIEQTVLRFNWDDSNTITHELTRHYYDFNAGFTSIPVSGGFDFKLYNNTLYSAVASALITQNPLPPNTARLLDRCDMYIYSSTRDFLNYQQRSLTQGTGLTGSEIEPIYSNVSGEGSIGLFTARGVRSAKITISNQTIDSLMISPVLHGANLQGRTF
jgi:hypothetical protein